MDFFSADSCSADMEEYHIPFTQLPTEILVNLLWLTDAKSVSQFYGATRACKNMFTQNNGLWQLLTCKICYWNAADVKKLDKHQNDEEARKFTVDWHKEYRVASYFDTKIRNAELTHNNCKPRPSKLQTIAKNYFRVDNCTQEEFGADSAYCVLQCVHPLYPLPIGNQSVAYYEVEILKLGELDFAVGAAQDGYVGKVGQGRSSYSFASHSTHGAVYLCSEFVSKESLSDPQYILHTNDIIGFGIDFSKQSVFGTKNGELIFDTTVDAFSRPISNINALHATVSLDNHEFKANFGSTPFTFDVLAYQRKHSVNTELNLYSRTIIPNMCSFQGYQYLAGVGKRVFDHYSSDFNPPKFKTTIPPLWYMTTYCRNDPNFPSIELSPSVLAQLRICRHLHTNEQLLKEMSEPTCDSVKRLLRALATMFDISDYEDKSWKDKVTGLLSRAFRHEMDLLSDLVHVTLNSTVELAFTSQRLEWALTVLAFHQKAFGWMPEGHYTKQAADDSLLSDNLNPLAVAWVGLLRLRERTMESVTNQLCVEILRQKQAEFAELKRIYNDDADLNTKSASMFSELERAIAAVVPPRTALENRLDPIYLYRYLVLTRKQSKPDQKNVAYFILYGIYKLEIDPEPFPTKEDYLIEVDKQIRAVIDNEILLGEFLHYLKKQAKNNLDDASFGNVVKPLQLFDVDPTLLKGPIQELRSAIINQITKLSLITKK